MADLTITASNVAPGTGANPRTVTAAEAITAGQSARIAAANGQAYKADNTTAEKAAASGIAVNSAAAGQPVAIVESGPVTLGAVLTVGEIYCVGAGAGGIAPVGDNGSGEYVTILGVATTTSSLQVRPNVSGVAKA